MIKIKSRTKTFRQTLVLEQLSDSDWKTIRQEKDLSEQINDWCKELDVQPFFVSAPALSVLGKDNNGHVNMIASIAILYNAEEELLSPLSDVKTRDAQPGAELDSNESIVERIKRLGGRTVPSWANAIVPGSDPRGPGGTVSEGPDGPISGQLGTP